MYFIACNHSNDTPCSCRDRRSTSAAARVHEQLAEPGYTTLNMTSRVVITGLGPITGSGVGIDPLWQAMLDGRSAIGRIRSFDASQFTCQVAAELDPDAFKVNKVVPRSYRKAVKVMCRDIELAVGAAAAVIEDAGLITRAVDSEQPPTINPDRFGCQIGAGLISSDIQELTAALVTARADDGVLDLRQWGAEGMNNLTPLWLLKYLPNMLACHVTIIHDCRGPSNTITCCEASSLLSIGESLRVIQRGDADACLSGGAEYKLNPMAYIRQEFTGRLAPFQCNGSDSAAAAAGVVKPFDKEAQGTVLGEGGGLLIIESLDSAREREHAKIYAEVCSVAASQSRCVDASGLNISDEDEGVANVMRTAIAQAGIAPEQIDAIAPFASGIPNSDRAEARAIHDVFGERAGDIPIIATVPFVGNCNAGNAAVVASIAAKSVYEQHLPARLNSSDCNGLNAAAAPAREATLEHVLVSTTSQGGQNAAMVLKRYSD